MQIKIIILLFLSFITITNAFAIPDDSVLVRRGKEIIIAYDKPLTDNIYTNSKRNSYATLSLDSVETPGAFSNQKILVSKRRIERFCKKVRRSNTAVICEANVVFKNSQEPNDELYSLLYGIKKIEAPSAWDISTGSAAVKVAVVDTGIDYTHQDLSANTSINTGEIENNGLDDDQNGYIDDYYGYNFIDDNGNPMDDNAHGSHCSGTIGASGNNTAGVSGINWNSSIIGVKVLDGSGEGTLDAVAFGVDYAVARGAKVINMSLGSSTSSRILRTSIINAKLSNILVVVAAGNETNNNDTTFSFPANFQVSNIISVAASDADDFLADFSNYGFNTVHLAAPGVDILSTVPNGDYNYLSGTSMAAPHVTGVAALIKAYRPELAASDIKDIILNTVDKISGLQWSVITGGRLNAYRALLQSANAAPSAPPSAGSSNIGLTAKKGKSSSSTVTVTGRLSDSEGGFAGERITAFCNNKKAGSKLTDRNGNYSIQIKKKSSSAKCQVKDQFGASSKRFSI